MENIKSFLQFKIVWRDEHMFELTISASNCRFSGRTEVYDTTDSLSKFAQLLAGYPKKSETLMYELDQSDSGGYFSMYFYCVDNAGHLGVNIKFEKDSPTYFQPGKKDSMSINIFIEPNSIDNFQKELLSLALKQEGTATLLGRDDL